MSNVLKIKSRQTGAAGTPASLARAELAYNEQDNTLYIGHGSGTDTSRAKNAIGGVGAFTDLASTQTLTNKNLTASSNTFPNLEAFTVGGNLNMGSNRIANLSAPTQPNDAARKADVDAAVQGLDVRESVRLASTSNHPNVGSTQSSAPSFDGVTAAAGNRILLKNQTNGSENGIYVVTYSNPNWVMGRATDLNSDSDCSANMFVFVEEGSSLSDTGWVCITNENVTLSNLAFAQFSGTGSFTAGDGLDLTGTSFSVDLKANSGLVIDSGEIKVDLSASSISGTLDIPDGGTGHTDFTAGDLLYGKGTGENNFSTLAAGTGILKMSSSTPSWTTAPTGLTIDCGNF
jgi:hypothetical protein